MTGQLSFKMGEIFSGPGGMSLGAHEAALLVDGVSLTHAWANDIDPDACETFRRNIPGASAETVICGDVRDLKMDRLSPIDGLSFGFPCNDFSVVGKSKGLGGRYGPLYSFGVSALNQHNPAWFVAENVSGLQSSNSGRALQQILEELGNAGDKGYRLFPHKYQFDLYGVPQKRTRIIIVGIREDVPVEFKIPSPDIYQHLDVRAGIALTSPPIRQDASNNEVTRQSERVMQRLSHIRPGENAFTADLPDHLRLNVRGATISQIYKRLRWESPSYTVTGSGGGGTHIYHWEENRALTNRERARLQTFPDGFSFAGGKESVRRQIGMAVPVAGAKAIFVALFKSFLGIDYPSIKGNIGHTSNSLFSIPFDGIGDSE